MHFLGNFTQQGYEKIDAIYTQLPLNFVFEICINCINTLREEIKLKGNFNEQSFALDTLKCDNCKKTFISPSKECPFCS